MGPSNQEEPIQSFQCHICASVFYSESNYTNHLRTVHKVHSLKQSLISKESIYYYPKKHTNDECETLQIQEIDITKQKNKNNERHQNNVLNGTDLKKLKNPKRSNKKMINNGKNGIKSKKQSEDKQLASNRVKTPHYCKECDRYFKSGSALGGHRGHKHSLKRKIGINHNDKSENGMNALNGIKSKKRKRIKTNNNKKNMDDAYIPRVKSIGTKRRKSKRLNGKKQKNEKKNIINNGINVKRKRLDDGKNKKIESEPPLKKRKTKPRLTITIKRLKRK